MVRKWLKAIFSSHIINIIKGNYYRLFSKNGGLYYDRYFSYCYECRYKDDSPIGEICGFCGCPLKSKLRVRDEKCELGRWLPIND